MKDLLETAGGQREKQRDRGVPLLPGGSQNRSIPIGIIATILLHLIVFLGVPNTFQTLNQHPKNTADDLEFELAPDEPPPPQEKFVETNPDAPANKPDKTQNFAAQDQQTAQEKPTDENSETPKTTGHDVPSNAVVSGQRSQPVEAANPGQPLPETQPTVETQTNPDRPQALKPLPSFDDFQGDDPDGLRTVTAKETPNPQSVEKEVKGQDQPTQNQEAVRNASTSPGRPVPRPRPRLPNFPSAVLNNQPMSASRAGVIGIDANFSEFGDYLSEMKEVVQAQWDKLLGNSRPPISGSRVVVRFVLNSAGEVQVMDVDEGTAGRFGTEMCLGAIRIPQKYRPWTKEMVAVLGNEQTITFTFYYW